MCNVFFVRSFVYFRFGLVCLSCLLFVVVAVFFLLFFVAVLFFLFFLFILNVRRLSMAKEEQFISMSNA